MNVNPHLAAMPAGYLFSEVARRVALFREAHPQKQLLKLGIGDVTLPLPACAAAAFSKAALEMATPEGFRGYPPEGGYPFLIDAILARDYAPLGVSFGRDEVFVSDGAKTDAAALQELFAPDCRIAVTDPVYPVYVDANAMAGRLGAWADGRWGRLEYLPCRAENGFVPPLPGRRADVIYLCYPNNPTGTTLTAEQLKPFVDYARENDALIIYDAAYRAYISRPGVPRSIYELEGARDVAVECCSFSKSAGFTGVRCAYTVIPEGVTGTDGPGRRVSLNRLWRRRLGSKSNGVSYPVQRAAEAAYSDEGWRQAREGVAYYMQNAGILLRELRSAGCEVYGGVDAPYLWMRTPRGMGSWAFFDFLLERAGVVGTPGAGFGPGGEGYFRLTAFHARQVAAEAAARIRGALG